MRTAQKKGSRTIKAVQDVTTDILLLTILQETTEFIKTMTGTTGTQKETWRSR
jgi:hypothetical protein